MKNLKKSSLTLMALGLCATSSFADLKLDSNLTINGFLDMSTVYTKPNVGKATTTASFDQFEVDFMYKYGDHISARADLNSTGDSLGTVKAEQAYATYTMGSTSVSVGKFRSATGWESAEPTGTYQFSYNNSVMAYGGYITGINAAYSAGMFGIYGALVTSEWYGDNDISSPGAEIQVSLMPVTGVTAKVAYLYEKVDAGNFNQQVINAWVSYVMGPMTLAVEYNMLKDFGAKGADANGGLATAIYKFTDKVAGTVRYSTIKWKGAAKANSEVTVSPCYSIASNWWVLAEARRDIDAKITTGALETTFTF